MKEQARENPTSSLLICHSYPPVLGGSEVEAQRICEALMARGHKIRVVCTGGDPMPNVTDWIDPKGIPVRIYSRRWTGGIKDIVFALRVAGMLIWERKNYQFVYFLMQGLQLATGVPIARLFGKPIIMKFSCSGIITRMQNSWFGRLELFFLKKWADQILVLNPGMREEALEVGFDEKKIGWMPNPVDTDYFRPASPIEERAYRKELNIPEEAFLVVFIGRLDPQKKIPWMLGGFARLVQQSPKALLAMIGDGPLRDELHALVRSLNIEKNMIFVGRVSTEAVLKWNQVADTCALVSEVEGLPCSLIEAMSVGVPPVLSDIPAHTQLVENEVHGLITRLGDEESIARGLHLVASDRGLRARMSAAARQRMIEVFSTPRVADRYESIFHSLTTGKPCRSEILAANSTTAADPGQDTFATLHHKAGTGSRS